MTIRNMIFNSHTDDNKKQHNHVRHSQILKTYWKFKMSSSRCNSCAHENMHILRFKYVPALIVHYKQYVKSLHKSTVVTRVNVFELPLTSHNACAYRYNIEVIILWQPLSHPYTMSILLCGTGHCSSISLRDIHKSSLWFIYISESVIWRAGCHYTYGLPEMCYSVATLHYT